MFKLADGWLYNNYDMLKLNDGLVSVITGIIRPWGHNNKCYVPSFAHTSLYMHILIGLSRIELALSSPLRHPA